MMHLEEDTYQQRLDLGLWKRVFELALPYKGYLIGIAVLAVVVAACESSFVLVTRWAIDDVTEGAGAFRVWPYIAVYLGLAVVLCLSVWAFIRFAGGLSHHLSHDIRRMAFIRLQELEFAYFDHRPTGWMIARLTSDCDKLSRILAWSLLDLSWAITLLTAISCILLVLNLKLGLLVLAVVPPLVVLSAWFQKRLLLSSRETRKYNSFITAAFSEGIQGIKTTKTFAREEENLDEFRQLSTNMYRFSVLNAVQSALYLPFVMTLGSIAAGLVLWVGGLDALAGTLTLGTLIAFIYYSGQFFEPINQVALLIVQLQGAQAAGERVLSLLAEKPAIVDSPEVIGRLKAQKRDPVAGCAEDGYPDRIGVIEYRDVDFAYSDGEPVLQAFNLRVEPGQTIALVGESGGGKSTLVNLVARFYEPTGGGIFIDGVEYRKRSLRWYQQQLGIVLQSPHLFAGTVRENIRYGRLDATDAEVEEVARLVNAHEFVAAMENGYDTEVGEGGNRLSTGQKQLISFARALLARPRLFIMDEATSSIDTETEALIQEALKTIFMGRTSFVIAHRLSTIRAADRILVIDKGRIRESGTHQELMSLKGHYFGLYARQYRSEAQTEALDELVH